MISIIVGTLLVLNYYNYSITPKVLILSSLFIFFLLSYTEYHRIKDWWAITDHSLVQSRGLLSKNVREIDFSSISDLDVDQPILKRILNFGNVNVRLFLNETSISITDINQPEDFIKELQSIISLNKRKKEHGIGTL